LLDLSKEKLHALDKRGKKVCVRLRLKKKYKILHAAPTCPAEVLTKSEA
jgi:hypothetical protein